MRESEEYLEDSQFISWDYDTGDSVILLEDAEHAVKLAYKEGYLEAIEDAYEALWGFTELTSKDVEQILERIKNKFNKSVQNI